MSMWEIEGLTELAVALVGAQDDGSADERNAHYAGLYGLESQFDCSFTHFRNGTVLMRDGFLRGVPLEEHPAFGAHRAALEKRCAARDAWLPMDPTDPASATAGLWTKREGDPEPRLWFDLMGPLAAALAERGALDVTLPPRWDDRETFARTLRLAAGSSAPGALDVLHGYYGFALWALPFPGAERPAVQPGDPILTPVLEDPVVAARLRDTKPQTDWVAERFALRAPHAEDGAALQAFFAWWRTPLG